MRANGVYLVNIIPHMVYTLLPLVLQCLHSIGKKVNSRYDIIIWTFQPALILCLYYYYLLLFNLSCIVIINIYLYIYISVAIIIFIIFNQYVLLLLILLSIVIIIIYYKYCYYFFIIFSYKLFWLIILEEPVHMLKVTHKETN